MCSELIYEQFLKKFETLSPQKIEVLQRYCVEVTRALGFEKIIPDDVCLFKIAEIVHYTSLDDVYAGQIKIDPDQSHLNTLFQTHYAAPKRTLASPDTTLATTVTSERCGQCRSTQTLTMAQQTRSVDEPMSFYTHCLNCRHRWRSS